MIEWEFRVCVLSLQCPFRFILMKMILFFDPFMGTGSTGVASLMLNRGFIGVEQELEWFDIAKNRLEK